ncbi:MAG TPA: ATP-binding protein [Candidatus Polarisedimenticolaceae bacterium]|nr:ATP-binding protein [Candidatus Polarisedimenticolaceae bacterium]
MALSRRARWIGLSLVLAGALFAVYNALERFVQAPTEFGSDRLLLHLLLIGIVVLVLGLLGVLVRNLVRLIVDRKHGILGSRLRTKLVFFFLGLVLLPTLVLFYGSTAVIRMTIDAMLRPALEDAVRPAQEASREGRAALRDQALWQVERGAAAVASAGHLGDARWDRLQAQLQALRTEHDLRLAAVVTGPETVTSLGAGVPLLDRQALLGRLRAVAEAASAADEPQSRLEEVSGGLLVLAAAPISPGLPGDALVVGRWISPAAAQALHGPMSAEDRFQALRAQRRDLVRFYLSLIGIIFLVTLFVATWIGFYLSRRITGPVQELAQAAREISGGNLGIRVRAPAGDEVGMLVEAFNEMASRLQESQEVITRGNADLRRSNQALDERRRYIETLLHSLSTGVLSLDRDSRITTANPAAERILGTPLVPGATIADALDGTRAAPVRGVLEEAVRAGRTVREELVLPGAQEMRTVSVSAAPLRGGRGEDLGSLVLLEDLTDLLRAQRMAAWREVARRMAHEIKNPLTPIQLAAQRLRRKWEAGAPDLSTVLPEATASIEHEVGALKRMVDEFSRFARLPGIQADTVDVPQIVDSVVALYRGLPGVTFDVRMEPGLQSIVGDGEQLRRALINLVDNAVAAMGGEGRIGISVRAGEEPGALRLEVADSGPGIAPRDRDKLFVPYFSTKARGTGLGLAIVQRVVSDHRGTIRVEDNEPRGARFVIDLPAGRG